MTTSLRTSRENTILDGTVYQPVAEVEYSESAFKVGGSHPLMLLATKDATSSCMAMASARS